MPAPRAEKKDPRRRLLRLATWLVKKGEATREEIYAEFSRDYASDAAANEKKWTRDKRDLNKLGIPIRFAEEEGEKGVYVVDPTSCTLPKLEFAPDEAAVLWMAGQAALRTHDHPLHDDLELALRKLALGAKGLPPRAAPLETDGTVLEREQVRAWLDVLTEAVERRKRLELTYRKPWGDTSERHVDVYGYAWRRGHWIFVGHCHLRNSIRVFMLERVQSLALAPDQKKKRDYEIPDDFDIRAWSRQEPWDYLVHEPREARVRFRRSLAKIAQQLVPAAEVTTEPDNARVARVVVRNLRGLVRQALAWGSEAEVIEPPEARRMARQLLDELAARLTPEVK